MPPGRRSELLYYQFARSLMVLALEMQSVAVAWQVYDITKRPLDLGLVGLAQFLPGVVLFLLAGHAADHFDRRNLMLWCYAGFIGCAAILLSFGNTQRVGPIYGVLVLLGVARSFHGPASQALLPQLIEDNYLAQAVAWGAGLRQGANILGPALGGVIYALYKGPAAVYATAVAVSVMSFFLMSRVSPRGRSARAQINLGTLLAGLRYIRQEKLVLGAISLDLFAVLLGGAVALLPVYAREILHTGPWGLGVLRSAPAVGAGIMAVTLGWKPIRTRAGATMLWCVGGFGLCTIVFGLSRNLVLSLVALLLLGASDMVSVVIRLTMVQLATRDEMRGRVSAVNMLFIGASNELGEFESGITAQWFGTVPAVVVGGIGTLVVLAIWAWRFPELRRADQLTTASSPN